jgi:hypothetical protein
VLSTQLAPIKRPSRHTGVVIRCVTTVTFLLSTTSEHPTPSSALQATPSVFQCNPYALRRLPLAFGYFSPRGFYATGGCTRRDNLELVFPHTRSSNLVLWQSSGSIPSKQSSFTCFLHCWSQRPGISLFCVQKWSEERKQLERATGSGL